MKAGFNSGKKFLVCGKFLAVAHNGSLAERPCSFSTPMQLQHRIEDWERSIEQPPSRVEEDVVHFEHVSEGVGGNLDESLERVPSSPTFPNVPQEKANDGNELEHDYLSGESSINALSGSESQSNDEESEKSVLPYSDMVFDDFDATCLCEGEPLAKLSVTYQSGLQGQSVWVCGGSESRCALKLFVINRKTKHPIFYNTTKAKVYEEKYFNDIKAGVVRSRSLQELKGSKLKEKPLPFKVVSEDSGKKAKKRHLPRDESDTPQKKLRQPVNKGTTDVEEDQWRSVPSHRQQQFKEIAKPIRKYTFG